jgi:hypothetical protein
MVGKGARLTRPTFGVTMGRLSFRLGVGMRKLWLVLALAATLLPAGCVREAASVPQPTAKQAIVAFNAIYRGFRGASAETSSGAWAVTGESIPESDDYSPVPVRVPIRVGGSGIASATVGGVRWTGSADLEALVTPKRDKDGYDLTIAEQFSEYTVGPGAVVVGASTVSSTSVAVLVETVVGIKPSLTFTWSPSDGWSSNAAYGSLNWLRTVGGVKVAYDSQVTKVLGPGLFTSEEGHGGGRYYTNAGHTATLHVVIGTDGGLEEVELTDGIALPNGLRLSDTPAFVSRALPANPRLNGKAALGSSVSAVRKQFGKPDQDSRTGVQHILTYDLTLGDDWWDNSYGFSRFTFVGDRLRSVSYYMNE